jgi:molybdopterin converting factor small subunit
MNVEVYFTTQLRAALGQSQQRVTLERGATVGELLRHLAQLHPAAFSTHVFDVQGQVLPGIMLCVGDQQVTDPELHVLQDDAVVTILSAISGG